MTAINPITIDDKQPQKAAGPRYKRWQGLMQDIEYEHDFQALRVEGEIPADISGVLYQNGPGTFSSHGKKYGHVFDGDGLIRGVKIEGGKAFGIAKLVQSEGLKAEREAGRSIYIGAGTEQRGLQGLKDRIQAVLSSNKPFAAAAAKNVANTSILLWQDRFMALLETDRPTELDFESLETRGETTLGGVIDGSFSAHPHWVSERKCGYNFGITVANNSLAYLDIYELPSSGQCKKLNRIKLSWRPFAHIHDFIATTKHLVFFIPPIHASLGGMLTSVVTGAAAFPKMKWREELGTEVIIVPIDNPKEIVRFKTDAFFPVHFANAYEENDKIVVDFTASSNTESYALFGASHLGFPDSYYAKKQKEAGYQTATMRRASIDVARQDIQFESLWSNTCEFPRIASNLQGSKHQYVYMLQLPADSELSAPLFTEILKLNVNNGESHRLCLGSEQYPLEPVFIYKDNAKSEDDGYLLSMVYDGQQHLSYLAIIGAKNIEAGPLAKLYFDQALPVSFHGVWYPKRY